METTNINRLTYKPHWTCAPLSQSASGENLCFLALDSQPALQRQLKLFFPNCEFIEITQNLSLETLKSYAQNHFVFVTQTPWSFRVEDRDFISVLRLFKNLQKLSLSQFDIITERSITSPEYHSCIHPMDGVYVGLGQTLSKELLHIKVRTFSLARLDAEHIRAAVQMSVATPLGTPVIIKDGMAYWSELVSTALTPVRSSAFKQHGHYLIVGANGGLGGVFSRYLAKEYNASLTLIGRKPSNEALVAELKRLGASRVTYCCLNIEDESAVQNTLAQLPELQGVIHSSLVLEDAMLDSLTEDSFLRVLAPKVRGTLNLIENLKNLPLDFILFFSSIQSYLANAGQANYTAACVAKDSIADLVHNLLMVDAYVVNWAYWGSVGIVATPEYQERMQKIGVGSIEPHEGIQIVEALLKSNERQIAVIKAQDSTLKKMNITPSQIEESRVISDSNSWVEHITPVYDAESTTVRSNELAVQALGDYTAHSLHSTSLPSTSLPRFQLLREALKHIPYRHSLSREELLRRYPQITGHVQLLDVCIENLSQILTGQKEPLEILFPHGSLERVIPVYTNNSIADYYNQIVAEIVTNYANTFPDRKLRILEIGSGTGSTAKFVVPKLKRRDAKYIFTDLSFAFLSNGKKLFSEFDFIDYQIVDVSKPIQLKSPVNVVVATNVIHATADVEKSIRHIAEVLEPDGIFILNEITAVQDFATLTFGLTDGWWLSKDSYRIPNSPLLDIENWRMLLQRNGFAEVTVHGSSGQNIFVCRRDAAQKQPAQVQDPKSNPLNGARALIVKAISQTLEMNPEDIEDSAPFSEYGVDSLITLEINKVLQNALGYLPSTLLFEYPSLELLANYLAKQYPEHFSPIESPSVVKPTVEFTTQTFLSHFSEDDDIAIVGMGVKLSQADSIPQFWKNLKAGKDAWTPVPFERWDSEIHTRQEGQDTQKGSYTTQGGFVSDIECFDPSFFQLTPNDAKRMDPQERLFLQQVYHLFQDAGYRLDQIKGTATGVFVGVMNGGYDWLTPKESEDITPTSLFWSIANRVSYFYDLKGPSLAVDTACSSSLTALHYACQALRSGDCRQAIVGGVNLIVHPRQFELLCNLHMLSKDGKCKAFGENADGFVDGEGICSLFIKKLADAKADGDRIYAVIRGSAVNSGGRGNGYYAPQVSAQSAVIQKALERARVEPHEVTYVEAHGTGTLLGDPIEIRALTSAFAGVAPGKIALGSLKSNLGHLESAAGLAGVIKAVLQMQHSTLVPTLHAKVANPHIDFESIPFRLNREVHPSNSERFVSCVSSFGAGGANAHVVLEKFPAATQNSTTSQKGPVTLMLSHKTPQGLQESINQLYQFLAESSVAIPLADLAYTLNETRDQFPHRVTFTVDSWKELLTKLKLDLTEHSNSQASHSLTQTQGNLISLPAYPFERKQCWIDAKESRFFDRKGIIQNHIIHHKPIAPASWFLSELLSQVQSTQGPWIFQNLTWFKPIENFSSVQMVQEGLEFTFKDAKTDTVYASGNFSPHTQLPNETYFGKTPHLFEFVEKAEIYNRFKGLGYQYGEKFQGIQWAKTQNGIVKCHLNAHADWNYPVSPALLDSGFQSAILMPQQIENSSTDILVPYHLDEFVVFALPMQEALYCYCELDTTLGNSSSIKNHFYFTDHLGKVLIRATGFTSVRMNSASLQQETSICRNHSQVICEVL